MNVETSLSSGYTRHMASSVFSDIATQNMHQLPDERNHNNGPSINSNIDSYMDMNCDMFAYDTKTRGQISDEKAGLSENDNDDESVSSELENSSAGGGRKNRTPKTPKKQSFTFSDCKICNDKATGVHYGISTCEGCKGFFKRNTQRNVYYQCFFGQNCKITPRTRNRCKACRFKRCIEVGMSFDGIKMGRIPKEVKKQALRSKLVNEQDNQQLVRNENDDSTISRNSQQLMQGNQSDLSNNIFNVENHAGVEQTPADFYGYSVGQIKKSINTSSGSISSSDSNSSNCNELQGSFFTNMNIKSIDKPDSAGELHEPIQQNQPTSIQQDENNNNFAFMTNNCEDNHSNMTTKSDSNISKTTNVGNEIVESKADDEDVNNSETAGGSATESTVSLRYNSDTTPLQLVSSQDMKELCLEQFLKSVNSGNKAARSNKNISEGANQQKKLFDSMTHQDEQLRLNNQGHKSTNLAFTSIVNNCSPFNMINVNIHSKFLHMYMSKTHYDPYFHMICSVLNDKIYQLYNEHTQKMNVIYEKLQKCLKQKAIDGDNYVQDEDFPLHNGTLELIWNGLIESLPEYVQSTFYFCKEMPGINELSQNDFSAILNNKLFEMFIIIHSKYFIDGESYLRLSNDVHYSRYWMNKVKGVKKTEATFELAEMLNEARMTEKERALLLPLMMTTCECDEDYLILKDLNECYTRAILYEFDLNNRDESFIIKMSKIISKIKWCKQIEMEAD